VSLGSDLQLVRSSHGLTTHDIAAESGYSVRLIHEIEADRIVVTETMITKILKTVIAYTVHGPQNVPEVTICTAPPRGSRRLRNPYADIRR
jgi:transcriptional regulator with XRE-family HTH domain